MKFDHRINSIFKQSEKEYKEENMEFDNILCSLFKENEQENMERMETLVLISDKKKMVDAVDCMMKDLYEEGFEEGDIEIYLKSLIDAKIIQLQNSKSFTSNDNY